MSSINMDEYLAPSKDFEGLNEIISKNCNFNDIFGDVLKPTAANEMEMELEHSFERFEMQPYKRKCEDMQKKESNKLINDCQYS